ncbi:dicarboxylate/amino acid:cation symporter [Salipaludibacillus sp. LMS25]|jgi:Na+/H+-dicarboxylate symporter|uniref:dicarboxylate/amino acid:cation symporter n=1 Tax=Salipaludibacillus sp. LMS25 TaxID=2924031 RepID=UPI0020D17B48|nr:dicarboxylate/amino acid:cation symporter [Salipaludibacillus sp. LMS25]UTR13143.1 dicarboxylate/amino acid:cation symporter [Salipaludibacillus sp. LMS25]
MKLIAKLVVGIIVGILIGLMDVQWITQLFVTIKNIFGQFIGFVIPFIILFFIVSGVSKLGKNSGRLVGATVGTAYVSTLLAGIFAFIVASAVMPFINATESQVGEGSGIPGFFELEIAPMMGVVTALVTAFLFGIGIAKTNSETLMKVFDEGKEIIELVITKIIIPFLPIYIAGIFVEMTAEGEVFNTLQVFGIVLVMVIITHWVWITLQFIVAGIVTKQEPFGLIKNMLPAYFTGVGTMSSAATIPVTLKQTKKNNVKEEVADFAVPLCATIHLSGSVITIVTCAVAVMAVLGDYSVPSIGEMVPVIAMLGIIMIAAPGVPGGAIMAALGILETMLGFSDGAIALMIALYMAQDSFGTATNVTGDGAINLIVNRIAKKNDKPAEEQPEFL